MDLRNRRRGYRLISMDFYRPYTGISLYRPPMQALMVGLVQVVARVEGSLGMWCF
jgi:hypothetical protein